MELKATQLCPWSGATCCECCPQEFPFLEDGKRRVCCQAWRDWTRQQIFVDKLKGVR